MGQDYNIYLHAVGGMGNGGGEQTKPKQLREDGEKNNKTTPKATASKIASVVQNPDSAIGMAMSTASGTISKAAGTGAGGVVLVAIAAAYKLAKKVTSQYYSYVPSASGNYKEMIDYNNFEKSISNFFSPVSTLFQVEHARLQIKKQNAVNEQQMLLTGGTILNSDYGRCL